MKLDLTANLADGIQSRSGGIKATLPGIDIKSLTVQAMLVYEVAAKDQVPEVLAVRHLDSIRASLFLPRA